MYSQKHNIADKNGVQNIFNRLLWCGNDKKHSYYHDDERNCMKNIQYGRWSVVLLFRIFMVYGQDEIVNKVTDSMDFPTHTTEQYIYDRKVSTYPWSRASMQFYKENYYEGVFVEDATVTHFFDSGITRTKITRATKDDVTITTTETWTSRKSSRVTWTNIFLICAIVGAGYAAHIKLVVADPLHPDYQYYRSMARKYHLHQAFGVQDTPVQEMHDSAVSFLESIRAFGQGYYDAGYNKYLWVKHFVG